RYRVTATDPAPCERGSEAAASRFELRVAVRERAVTHCDLLRPDERAAFKELHRRERHVVGGVLFERAERLAGHRSSGLLALGAPNTPHDNPCIIVLASD